MPGEEVAFIPIEASFLETPTPIARTDLIMMTKDLLSHISLTALLIVKLSRRRCWRCVLPVRAVNAGGIHGGLPQCLGLHKWPHGSEGNDRITE